MITVCICMCLNTKKSQTVLGQELYNYKNLLLAVRSCSTTLLIEYICLKIIELNLLNTSKSVSMVVFVVQYNFNQCENIYNLPRVQ